MSRTRLLLAALAAAALALPAVAGGDELPPAARVSAQASFSPRVVLFGASTTAELRVLVDPGTVDPRTVRVSADFAPFTVTGRPATQIVRTGAGTEVRVSYRVQCLAAACSHPGGQAIVPLRPARIGWAGAPRAMLAEWPPVAVASRLTRADVVRPELRYDATPADGGYRVDPHAVGLAAVGLAGGAVVALGAALALMARGRRLGREHADVSSPLERAITRVERSADGPPGERRAAIGELAYVLEHDGFPELAPLARRLAWASGSPSGGVARDLALLVRSAFEAAA